jgi:hypothetical protein
MRYSSGWMCAFVVARDAFQVCLLAPRGVSTLAGHPVPSVPVPLHPVGWGSRKVTIDRCVGRSTGEL